MIPVIGFFIGFFAFFFPRWKLTIICCPKLVWLCKVNKDSTNWHFWVVEVLMFILTHVDEKAWVFLNVRTSRNNEIKKVLHSTNWNWLLHLAMSLNPLVQILLSICHSLTHKIK
jgi:hypothetical protein